MVRGHGFRGGAVFLRICFEGGRLLGMGARGSLRPGRARPSPGGKRPGTSLVAALRFVDMR